MQTIGATSNPAAPAEAASAPVRSPKLCVFHFETLFDSDGFLRAGIGRDFGTFFMDDTTEELPVAASLLPRVSSCKGIEEESTRVAFRHVAASVCSGERWTPRL